MPGISYDDSGSLANYFGVTFLACALIPYTYAVFKPAKTGELPLYIPWLAVSACYLHPHPTAQLIQQTPSSPSAHAQNAPLSSGTSAPKRPACANANSSAV
jgi:hypothetical protein